MIFSAGYGTRLGDATRETPKGMLPVGEHPILAYIVAHLRSQGFDELAINVHFQAETIRGHFGDGSSWGVDLTWSHEKELLGTAGGAKKMADFLSGGDPFLLHYGDIVTDQDFQAMARFHRERDALATLLVHERAKSNSVIVLDEARRITAFLERPDEEERRGIASRWVNSGVCVCSPELLDLIPDRTPADLPRDVFVPLVATGRLFGYPLSGYRCAVDSEARLAEARSAVAEGRLRSPLLRTGE